MGSIGDTIWEDFDLDGVFDEDEFGLWDTTVNLYLDDGDGVFEPGSDDTLVATTITDWDGLYLFTDLEAGVYWVDAIPFDDLYVATTDNPYGPIDLDPGEVYLDADIGFFGMGI